MCDHGRRGVAAGAGTAELTLERLRRMPELARSLHPTGPGHFGVAERGIIALLNEERLRRVLYRMLDENEFLSPYGIRSLSRYHAEHPYVLRVGSQEYRVDYPDTSSAQWQVCCGRSIRNGRGNLPKSIWQPFLTIELAPVRLQQRLPLRLY
jgi:hypothetical protein